MIIPVTAAAKKRNKAEEAEAPVKNNVLTPKVEQRGGARRYVNPVSLTAGLIVWFIGIVIAVIVGPQN